MDAHGRENRAGTLLPPAAPLAFRLLAKPTGAICNLDCTYCFFLSKELLYPGSRYRIADDRLALYLRQLIEAHAASPEVVVAWQGGKPTMMGLDFSGALPAGRGAGAARPADRVHDPDQRHPPGRCVGRVLRRARLPRGAVDRRPARGPRHLPVDKGGKGSFARVMKGLATLQRHGVEWNALTTVHAAICTGGPLRGTRLQARQHPRHDDDRPDHLAAADGLTWPNGTLFRVSADGATCASPATADARRSGSPSRQTASRDCITCARA